MYNRRLFGAGVAVLGGLLCAGNALADSSAEHEVRCAEINFSKSAELRDQDQFIAAIDADARFVAASVLHGPEEIARAWAPFFEEGGPSIKWRPRFVEVLESGDLALSRGPYRIETSADDGSRTVAWGTFNSVWRRNEQGQWRVVFDAGSAANEQPPDGAQSILDQPDACEPLK